MTAISEQHARDNTLSAIKMLRMVPFNPEMFSFMIMAFVEASEEGIAKERASLFQTLFQEEKVTKEEFNSWSSGFAKQEGYDTFDDEGMQKLTDFFFA